MGTRWWFIFITLYKSLTYSYKLLISSILQSMKLSFKDEVTWQITYCCIQLPLKHSLKCHWWLSYCRDFFFFFWPYRLQDHSSPTSDQTEALRSVCRVLTTRPLGNSLRWNRKEHKLATWKFSQGIKYLLNVVWSSALLPRSPCTH